uniref:BTB domain-containing protein n=1 Tax=Panagrolaimus sp. ES5 TaxID=591445 RepID=A0AC34FES4_9BILA
MHKNGNRSSETPSPTKFIGAGNHNNISSSNNEIDNDFHHFRIPSSLEPYPSSASATAMRDPVRRTHSSNNYYEPSNEYFQLSTPQPPRRTYHQHHQKSPNFSGGGPSRSKAASTQFLNNGALGSNEYLTETWNSSNPYNEIRGDWSPKPRSISPRKSPRETTSREEYYDTTQQKKPKSQSKKHRNQNISNTYDYLNPQCKIEGCSAAIIVEDSRFLACKHQLSQASIFFRTLFIDHRAFPVSGVEQTATNEFVVVVSGLRFPAPPTQFRWFIESSIPCPILKDITEETLETCMRLSKRFEA